MSSEKSDSISFKKKTQIKSFFKNIISNSTIGPLLTLLFVVMIFIVLGTDFFLSYRNLSNILSLSSPIIILAMGSTLVLLTGSIDLSMEGTMALSSVLVGFLISNSNNNMDLGFWAVPIVIAAGALVGFTNGIIHFKLKIPSLIGSLGVWFMTLGIAVIITGGIPITLKDKNIREFATGDIFGIPYIFILAIFILLILLLIEKRTRIGKYIFAIGGNEVLARQIGINIGKVKLIVFSIAGMLYALAGFINAARLASADEKTSNGFLFVAITAAIVGGTAITGGYGGSFNALIGALIVIVLKDGMILRGVNIYFQNMVYGLVLIIAVALTIDRKKMPAIK